jgi:ribosome biogenesis protein BRX1
MSLQPEFVSPAAVRSALKRTKGERYRLRKQGEEEVSKRKEGRRRDEDVLAVSKVFA